MDIIKTIIPAAGLGSRFWPFTKAVPKEMLPVLNIPAIQYIVKEGIDSEIANFIMVVSRDKQAIARHFDSNLEFEAFFKERDKLDLLKELDKINRIANFMYVRQAEPLGLGHAVWLARHAINKEYFGIQLPDDIIIAQRPALSQLIKIARQEKASVIAVQEVNPQEVSSYGVIAIKKQITPNLFQVSHLVEKPDQKEAPSNLAVIGRYILSHKIFDALEEIEPDERGELQLTDAITQMIRNNEKVFAFKIQGIRYDIGTPLGWIKANIGCSLQDPQTAPHIGRLLENKKELDAFLYNPTKIIEHEL